jgi:flavin reductase (DIM6/NTAB) family NADH-FMN oxidoreductase RutF
MERTDDYRLGMQRLASGVSILTAVGSDGIRYGLTATAVCALSWSPPSLVACINKKSRMAEIIRDASTFAVSILGTSHRHVAEAFAGQVSGLTGSARFAYGKWFCSSEGVPILDDAPACFICKVDDIIDRSTHLLLIGGVTDVHVQEKDAALLVYFSRRFTRVGPVGVPELAINGGGIGFDDAAVDRQTDETSQSGWQ